MKMQKIHYFYSKSQRVFSDPFLNAHHNTPSQKGVGTYNICFMEDVVCRIFSCRRAVKNE